MKTLILITSFLTAMHLLQVAPSNGPRIIDLEDTLKKYDYAFENIHRINIVRGNIRDSIVLSSPVLGTSTCLSVNHNKAYDPRISGNCDALSTFNLTGLEDGDYDLLYMSCYSGGTIKIRLATAKESPR